MTAIAANPTGAATPHAPKHLSINATIVNTAPKITPVRDGEGMSATDAEGSADVPLGRAFGAGAQRGRPRGWRAPINHSRWPADRASRHSARRERSRSVGIGGQFSLHTGTTWHACGVGDALEAAPPWVRELKESLIDAGYPLLEERRFDEAFGNYAGTFGQGWLRLQLNRDRGVWDLLLWDSRRPTDVRGYPRQTNVHLLRAADSGYEDFSSIPDPDVEADAGWLLDNLSRVGQLLDERKTWLRLDLIRRSYARQRFGVDLPAQADP